MLLAVTSATYRFRRAYKLMQDIFWATAWGILWGTVSAEELILFKRIPKQVLHRLSRSDRGAVFGLV